MFLFRSKQFDPDQFENELKKVTSKISQNEKRLRKLQVQKKYYTKVIPLYLSSAYVIYFSYLYQMDFLKRSKNILTLIIAPLIIGVIYYTIISFFDYLINNKESYIEHLKNEHNEKLMVLKDKTNFDKTRDLLARFSDGEDIKEMEKEVDEMRQKKAQYLKMIQAGEEGKILEDLQHGQRTNNGFYNHFLTTLLGENELGPDKRYALICSNCFQHNGLAPPGKTAMQVRYICPKCGTLNGNQAIEKQRATNEENEEHQATAASD
ncbi:hypothetical protein CAS74_000986 [Pichia kudriavzevii]|nr:hypothetical protein JL09_g627 [Pichia kudriavzevii]ONH69291.1 Protein lunapark [Pichia kudriavzevii]ONH76341.1 Protein lunapark [Pichia kudriavzevii]OUT24598.1 hypothetical protein CAS74_000986 [Pichia kudriavzevii]